MKKILLKSALSLLLVGFVSYGSYRAYSTYGIESENEFLLANVEALATSTEEVTNTGPGQVYDCPGIGTGDGKMCMSENSYPCTQILC